VYLKHKKFRFPAFTLTELSVVMTGPTKDAARTMLRSAFASAKAKAAAGQKYVGVRFQQNSQGRSYLVFVQPAEDQTDSYLVMRAIPDTEPIPLPEGVELAELEGIENDRTTGSTATGPQYGDINLFSDYLIDTTTFTVLFAPDGRIVRKRVQIQSRGPEDTMFNNMIDNPDGKPPYLFREDPYLKPPNTRKDDYNEISQASLMIYEQDKRKNAGMTPYTGYVRIQALRVHLNVYTGDLIRLNPDQEEE